MTEKEAICAIKKLDLNDKESAHVTADEILLSFLETNGYRNLAVAWRKSSADCCGFWYA